MKVYIKNCKGEQTVRNLSFFTILKIKWYQWMNVPKEERAEIKFLVG
jgi:hypothetical protein